MLHDNFQNKIFVLIFLKFLFSFQMRYKQWFWAHTPQLENTFKKSLKQLALLKLDLHSMLPWKGEF